MDVRKLYEISGGNISSIHLARMLGDELSKLSKIQKFLSLLKRVRGISFEGATVDVNPKGLSLSDLFEKFNEISDKEEKKFVVFSDEAQYFRYYGSRGGNDILALFAYCYDNLGNVKVIITDSEVGVLHDFLKLDDYTSPLHGRGVGFLTLKPFSLEESMEFLKRGFDEAGERVDSVSLEKVVEEIDGIPGYLVLFGVKYIGSKNEGTALAEVFDTARILFEEELDELKRRSPRYLFILKQLAQGVNSWFSLKNLFHAKGDFVSDSNLYSLLKTLEKMSFIEKTTEVARSSISCWKRF